MTKEEQILDEIRKHIDTRPDKEKIENYAGDIRRFYVADEAGVLAIALIGAELATRS